MIELNRSRNNVVLSRRAVLEEERKEVRQQILDRLQPGQVVEGAISNIVDFGAFVDLDGIDGLIHISELSWSHVNHPSEILSIGDTVPVKVLDIDRDRQRISLGLKQTQEDPWQRVVDTYNLGDELEGKVTKVVTFGAFVEIMDGVEGLVHISELAHHHVENPREVVEPGDDVKVKILEIDSERRRLSLSVKRVAGNEPPPARGRQPGGPDLGEVRDLGLSDDVFAGPDIAGAADLRAAVAAAQEPEEAPRRRGARGARRGAPPRRPPRRSRRRPLPRSRARREEPAAAEAPRAGGLRRGRSGRRARARRVLDGRARRAGSLRRPDRRPRRRQVRRRWRRWRSSAPPRSRPTRSCTSCYGSTEVRDAVAERFGPDVVVDGVVDRGAVAARGVRRPRASASGSRGCCGRGWASGSPEWRDAVGPTVPAARGGGAAAVRVRAWRRPSTTRSPWSPTRPCARERAGARGHAAVERARRAAAHAGREVAACGLHGAKRRHAVTS